MRLVKKSEKSAGSIEDRLRCGQCHGEYVTLYACRGCWTQHERRADLDREFLNDRWRDALNATQRGWRERLENELRRRDEHLQVELWRQGDRQQRERWAGTVDWSAGYRQPMGDAFRVVSEPVRFIGSSGGGWREMPRRAAMAELIPTPAARTVHRQEQREQDLVPTTKSRSGGEVDTRGGDADSNSTSNDGTGEADTSSGEGDTGKDDASEEDSSRDGAEHVELKADAATCFQSDIKPCTHPGGHKAEGDDVSGEQRVEAREVG